MRLETERFFRRLQQKRPLVYEDEGSGQGFVCGPEKKELVEMGLTGMSDLWDTQNKEVTNSLLLKSEVQNFSIVLTVLSPYPFRCI